MGAYNATTWLLDRHVEEGRGTRTAIRCSGSSLSYGELRGETFRAQHALAALGIAAGDRVVLVVNDEPAFPAWFLGAMRAGVVPVAVSTMLTSDDLAAIVADAGARAVVVSQPFADHLARITTTAPSVEQAVVIGEQAVTLACRSTRGTTSTTARTFRLPTPDRIPRRSGSTARGRRGCQRAWCTATPAHRPPPRRMHVACCESPRTTASSRSPSCSSPTDSATR